MSPCMTLPDIHDAYVIEAHEQASAISFAESSLGRLPLEIRSQVYNLVLLVPTPANRYTDNSWHHPLRPAKNIRPEWENQHRHFGRRCKEYIWPRITQSPETKRGEEGDSSLRNALTATFPVPTSSRLSSRLDILLTCRQIYLEARLLYYSTNNFYSADYKTLLQFLHLLDTPRRREIVHISVTRSIYDNPDDIEQTVRLLQECKNLWFLRLQLRPEDSSCLPILRQSRGLKVAEFTVCHYSPHDNPPESPKGRLWLELQEIRKEILLPKGRVLVDAKEVV